MREGQDVLDARPPGLDREWLLADGAGGSACGTVSGTPRHRGHALLHAPGPGGDTLALLLGVEDRVHAQDALYDLFARAWPGSDLPVAELQEHRREPWPLWRLRCGETSLERSLFLVHGHHALVVSYRHLSGPAARIRVSPLIVARPAGELQRETEALQGLARAIPGRARFETLPGAPSLTVWHNGAFLPARLWRRGLAYSGEAKPGQEDALVPGHVDALLGPGDALHLVASSEEALFRTLAVEGRLGTPPPSTLAGCVDLLARAERQRLESSEPALLAGADFTARQAAASQGEDVLARRPAPLRSARDPWTAPLIRSLERGLVRRSGRWTLACSYPEAREKGSEVLRALPGLISVRAFAESQAVLRGYLEYLDDGLVPESFAGGEPCYGDPEPSLWAIHAAELWVRRSGDAEWLRSGLYAQLESIVQFLRSGSRHGVRTGSDGLIEVGPIEEAVRPARLNVLWYHALVAVAQLARLGGHKESAAFYLAWARQHGQSFNERFWNEPEGCLWGSLRGDQRQPGLDPSQVLAASLAPPLLPPERASRLLETLESRRFTPLGFHEPGSGALDPAWLGDFLSATLRAGRRNPEARERAGGWLALLRRALGEAGGGIPARFELPRRVGRGRARTPPEAPPADWEAAVPRGESALAAALLLRTWIEDTIAAEPVPAP